MEFPLTELHTDYPNSLWKPTTSPQQKAQRNPFLMFFMLYGVLPIVLSHTGIIHVFTDVEKFDNFHTSISSTSPFKPEQTASPLDTNLNKTMQCKKCSILGIFSVLLHLIEMRKDQEQKNT
jgi:hypothetical protein